FALVSVAAALDVRAGTVAGVRLALGGVAPKPWRATEAERALTGAPAAWESFQRAADAELAAAVPRSQNAFKIELARRAIVAVLGRLAGEAVAAWPRLRRRPAAPGGRPGGSGHRSPPPP